MGLVNNYGVVVRLDGFSGEKELDLTDCVDANGGVGHDMKCVRPFGKLRVNCC